MYNKEVLGIIVFFVGVMGFLVLFVSTGPTAQLASQNNLSFNDTSNVNFAADFNGTITTGSVNTSSDCIPLGSQPGYVTIGEHLWDLITGKSATPVCHGATVIAGVIGAIVTGQPVDQQAYQNPNTFGTILTIAIGLATAFGATAMILAILGSGETALAVGASGIGITLIYFMTAIMNTTIFVGTPTYIIALVDVLFGALYLWIIITMLRS